MKNDCCTFGRRLVAAMVVHIGRGVSVVCGIDSDRSILQLDARLTVKALSAVFDVL